MTPLSATDKGESRLSLTVAESTTNMDKGTKLQWSWTNFFRGETTTQQSSNDNIASNQVVLDDGQEEGSSKVLSSKSLGSKYNSCFKKTSANRGNETQEKENLEPNLDPKRLDTKQIQQYRRLSSGALAPDDSGAKLPDASQSTKKDADKGTFHKLIDFGTAIGLRDENGEGMELMMTISEIKFAGTPAYSSPESFNDQNDLTVLSDIWSLAVTLFHITTGKLPFDCPDAMTAALNIARDMDSSPPDVRDYASDSENLKISSELASVISKGMQKRIQNRFRSVDEMATALHGCLVSTGDLFYSAFISYQGASERYHALMLYDVLNNTITPAGRRVIVYLDFKRLESEDWEESLAAGLMNSLVALPLLSAGMINSLLRLSGNNDDPADRMAQELMLMNALNNHKSMTSTSRLETIFPILVGRPLGPEDPNYPCSGNFFTDGSNVNVKRLARRVSQAVVNAVHHFLKKHHLEFAEDEYASPIADTVKDLFSVQGAQLWNHGPLAAEAIPEDSEFWSTVSTTQSDPPLDLAQLRMLKAELRALIPAIHEVIDRAQTSAVNRFAVATAVSERRKILMAKVVRRMIIESVSDMFHTWSEAAQEAKMASVLQYRMRNMHGKSR